MFMYEDRGHSNVTNIHLALNLRECEYRGEGSETHSSDILTLTNLGALKGYQVRQLHKGNIFNAYIHTYIGN